VRIGDEGREPPVGLGKAGDGAAEHQPPVDPHRVEHRVPDRLGEVALDEILKAQEVVGRARLPVLSLGLDAPRGDFAVADALGPADRRRELVEPAELAQLGPEHAIVLRQTARIVALHVDDMAVLNAH
jgi:hypothetical protein